MGIDFPDSAFDGQEFIFGGYNFVYNGQKNKWTSILSYLAEGGITSDAFASPTTLNLLNDQGAIVKTLQASGSGNAPNNITETRVDVVSTESRTTVFDIPNEDPYLLYWSVRDGIPRTLDSQAIQWKKYSFPKSLTANNPNVYFRLYTEAIGDQLISASQVLGPGTEIIVSNQPNDNEGGKIHSVGGFSFSPRTAENDLTNGDNVTYAFLNVLEDPSNSNNFAVYVKVVAIGDKCTGQIYISGYLKTTNVTSEKLEAAGISEVYVSEVAPTDAAAGDIWYETNDDGTYTTNIWNNTTNEWEPAEEKAIEEPELAIPNGDNGEVLYYTGLNSKDVEAKTIADVGRYVLESEVAQATTAGARAEEIFNSWYRFSHNRTENYPARESELQAWAFDESTGIIQCTANTGTYVGFVSDESGASYTHEVTLTSSQSDNDTVAVVMAFVTEGTPGQPGYREHTLTATVTTGGTPSRLGWGVYYNYLQSDQKLIQEISIDPSGGWSGKTVRVRIEKTGKNWLARTSQFNSLTPDTATDISFSTDDDPDFAKFEGEVKYGYGAYSQGGASFVDPIVSGFSASTVYDMENQVAYSFNQSTGEYQPDPNAFVSLGLNNRGRFLINQANGQLFYADLNGSIVNLNSFPQLSSYTVTQANDLDALVGQMIYVENESGGSVPAFYDGTNWRRVTDRNIVS